MKQFIFTSLTCIAPFFLIGQARPKIAITADNLTKRYCVGDQEVGIIQLSGKFDYQNLSKSSVLLLRHSHYVESVRLIAENPIVAEKRQYLLSINTVTETLAPALAFSRSDFIQLGQNERFSELKSFTFPFRKLGKTSSGDIPPDGNYTISALVTTWPDSVEEAERIGKFLGTPISIQPLWSPPLRIEIRSGTQEQSCRN